MIYEDPEEGRESAADEPAEEPATAEGGEGSRAPESALRDIETPALIQRAKEDDSAALNELFARHYQLMLETARRRLGARLKSKEEPDDLAQTTFREATRDFHNYDYRGEGSLQRWLLQILQNKIRDRAEFYSAGKRDLSKERSMDATPTNTGEVRSPFELPSADLTITSQVTRGENYDMLHQALAQLSPDHRAAITLAFFQGQTLREAGRQMGGRSEDAVRMLLRRAEGRLRELLRPSLGKDRRPE
ncbi:MAG: sigma-70 family RNA polymerase sigma factor [Planctomycetota bacterium]|jgi:RNA polymerase sigma-70 factor (ECF subfamily)|nr:sigma-70 family RNA polymerase sigma factor [Planctomycetota bacterium]